MNSEKRWGLRVTCTLAAMALLACSTAIADENDAIHIRLDPDGDGVFEKVATYAVSPEEALIAFANNGGAPWDGRGPVLAGPEVPGLSFEGPQSWDGFLAFLDETYTNELSQGRMPLCDDTVFVTYEWDCGPPLDCTPVTDCEGWVMNLVWTSWECIVGGDPPCPPEKPFCLKTGVVPAFTYAGWSTLPCVCSAGEGSDCVPDPAATLVGIAHTGDVCECAIPTVSEWGLIVLTLLLLTAGGIMIARRRRAAVA